MNRPNGNGQSIIAKLTGIQRATGWPHQYLIDRFAQERFLYRLSTGRHRELFVLKGGLLLTAMTGRFYRATRDIDVRAFAENDPEAVRTLVTQGISHEVEDDGMTFDVGSIAISEITAQGEERGLRLVMAARLGRTARTRVQMDMGFADSILLPQETFEFPVLLSEYPPPVVRAYSVESIIAEKLEAIASLDKQNSRYKDFDDILVLGANHRLHVAPVSHAITMTFERRGTPLARLMPALGTDRSTADRERAYQSYRKKLAVEGEATTFAAQLERLREFVAPVIQYVDDGVARALENGAWTMI